MHDLFMATVIVLLHEILLYGPVNQNVYAVFSVGSTVAEPETATDFSDSAPNVAVAEVAPELVQVSIHALPDCVVFTLQVGA